MEAKHEDLFVSTLIVAHKPLALLEDCLQETQTALKNHYNDYEILIIRQGPHLLMTAADELVLKKIPSIRFIQLSSSVSEDVAWSAALENAIGDFVVLFNPETDPVSVIFDTVALGASGYDVVVGVSEHSTTWAYRVLRFAANYLLNKIDYKLPRNSTPLRCLSRRAVLSVTATGRFHHQLSMKMQKTGYTHVSYPYKAKNGLILSRSFFKSAQDFLRLLIFNSAHPLRWMSCVGLIGSSSAFIFASYSLLIALFKGHVAEGWTTTIFFMSTMFMLQFVMMAFFGEYLGRLLDDRSEQDNYSVVFEKTSTVMVNQDRINVLGSATNERSN